MTTTTLAFIPSPSQGVWHLGPLPVRAYALFIIVGIIAALVIGDRRWVARGGERGVIYDVALWAVPFGLVGGRLYHVITDWQTYFGEGGAGLGAAFRVWDGGLGIWGAVALGAVGAWIACRRYGIPLPAFGDAIAPGIILAQAIGRLGNYFNQELYGRQTRVPWGLEIYERRDASGALDTLNGVSTGQLIQIVHPTFLYELLWNLVVFAVLIWVDRRFKFGHGRLFALYVAGYCLGRFCVELMRSDAATHIAGIRINSFTSTFVFIGAVVYIMVAPKGREDPSSLKGKPRDVEVAGKESPVDEVAKELAAVAATSGVVAAAKVAGDDEDADAKAVGDGGEHSAELDAKSEAEAEAEALVEAVDSAPAEDIAEAEEFAAAGEEAEASSEAEAEAEELADDVEEAPSDEITEAEEFAAAGEESDAEPEAIADEAPIEELEAEPESAEAEPEPLAGVGAVEGEEAVEAQEAAGQAHESAVEGADEAEAVAEEVAAEEPSEPAAPEADSGDAETVEPGAEETEKGSDSAEAEPESLAGVGAVEGEEAVEAQEGAGQAHESAVAGAEEAQVVAEEVAAQESEAEPEATQGESSQSETSAQPATAQSSGTVTSAGRRRWWSRQR